MGCCDGHAIRRPPTTALDDPSVEDAVDALEDGDRTIRPGSARAALRHTVFRRVFIGAFLSNIGSWMQNVVLGALAYDLTESPTFVGVLLFAQLGPLLLFSLVGGLLADMFDRRRLLVTVSLLQGAAVAAAWRWVAWSDDPSQGGAGRRSCSSSAWARRCSARPTAPCSPPSSASDDLAGAISLNSAQMNGSRVIGPIIGAVLFAAGRRGVGVRGQRRLVPARDLVAAQRAPPAARARHERAAGASAGCSPGSRSPSTTRSSAACLVIIFVFSLLSLPFIGQMPTLADRTSASTPRARSTASSTRASASARCSARCRSARCWPAGKLERVVRVGLVVFAGLPRRVLAAAQSTTGLPGDPARGPGLLRGDHLAVDGAAAAARRQQPRPGHGAVDHGLRRHRAHRQPHRRPPDRGHVDHHRRAGRRRRSPSAWPSTPTWRNDRICVPPAPACGAGRTQILGSQRGASPPSSPGPFGRAKKVTWNRAPSVGSTW